uniref:Uncharacterized protein n=1 Tax=Cyprinodon variegatus TaxID=28743 RepID=A0A3Q2DLX8_CYPVA
MTCDHERWACDKNELQVVVTNIDTAWLGSVADKVFVFVPPDTLSRHHKHHDPEDEHHREPDPAKGSGSTPVHDFLLMYVFDKCLDDFHLKKKGKGKLIKE